MTTRQHMAQKARRFREFHERGMLAETLPSRPTLPTAPPPARMFYAGKSVWGALAFSRPFEVRCLHTYKAFVFPTKGVKTYHVHFGIPGYVAQHEAFTTAREAIAATEGALWAGAPYVIVEFSDGCEFTQEVWVAK